MINEVIKGLANVATYLDDVIVFDSDPSVHVHTITGLFKHLRKHSLKLSVSKAKIGATDADFLDPTISPAGIRPNASKVAALTKTPMSADVKQLRSLFGGLTYHGKTLADMAKRIRPTTSLLKHGLKFVSSPSTETIVKTLLEALSAPPFWSTLTGARSPTTPALSSFTATLASVDVELSSRENRRMSQSAL